MPDPWCPFLEHDPGEAAGYSRGRNRMQTVILHYTAGAYGGDYSVGKRGYFNFYIPRDRPAVQFAEADALTWHAGNFNIVGPGIEFELLNDSINYTPHQFDLGGQLIRWLHDEWGITYDFFDTGGDNGQRRIPGQIEPGFTTHRSLQQSPNNHTDYVTRAEFVRMVGTPGDDDDMATWKDWTLEEKLDFAGFVRAQVEAVVDEKMAAGDLFEYAKFIQDQVKNATQPAD